MMIVKTVSEHTETLYDGAIFAANSLEKYTQLLLDGKVLFDSRKEDIADFLTREFRAKRIDTTKQVKETHKSKGFR